MGTTKKVIIVNGEKHSATILYRSQAAQLCFRELGFIVDTHDIDSLEKIELDNVGLCIFVRTPLTPSINLFVERLKCSGIAVIADFDDLVFCPELLHLFDGIRYLSDQQRILFVNRVHQYQSMLKIADLVILTTVPLATEASRFNKNCVVIRNYPLSVTKRMSRNVGEKLKNSEKFVIGYYSGTLTHQADFKQCASSLVRCMHLYSEVELRIVGEVEMSEFVEFIGLDSRVTQVPLLPYEGMLLDLLSCDINIAPLECGNVFCESKSELKYFDAALMCVPTVASATLPFRAAINHGVDGYLAEKQEDWFVCFESILRNKKAVKKVGQNARRHVLSFFGEAAQLNDYRALMKLFFERRV